MWNQNVYVLFVYKAYVYTCIDNGLLIECAIDCNGLISLGLPPQTVKFPIGYPCVKWGCITVDLTFYTARPHCLQCRALLYLTAIPSVSPSVTRWYLIQTNEDRITRSLLWGSKNTLVFWYQQWLGRRPLLYLKFALKVIHIPRPLKSADFDQYLLISLNRKR